MILGKISPLSLHLKTYHLEEGLTKKAQGNGNPLQCSCLENSRDGGTWWAAVYGVAQTEATSAAAAEQEGVRHWNQWAEEGSQKRAETKSLLLLQMRTDGDPRPQTRTLPGGLRFTDLIKTKDVDSSP